MRADGKRVKNIDNMYTIASFIMDQRCDALNSIEVHIPYEPMHKYVLDARKRGHSLSYMSLILAGYVRTLCKYPALNRFVANKRIYYRDNVTISMVVGRMDGAEGTMTKLKLNFDDTVFEINEKIEKFINENRSEDSNKTDKLMSVLVNTPGLLSFGIKLFKFLDKHGLLPRAITEASPFHASMVISNLASIRTNHIYHHIYNFGTISMIITMGNLMNIPKYKDDKVVLERVMPLGIVTDERICSGSYYARAFRELLKLLEHPEVLEQKPTEIISDF